MKRHITLATDLSARSDRAFERAVQLAHQWGARLSIVHAVEGHHYASWREGSSWRWTPDPVEWARTKLQREYPDWDSVAAELEVKAGNPHEVIHAAAVRNDTDLIISGVARDEPYGRDILGRLISELTRTAPAPVLVVKKRLSGPYRRILVASDLSVASREPFQLALRLFSAEELTLYHAVDAGADSSSEQEILPLCRKWMEDMAGERASAVRVVTERGSAARMLKQYIDDNDVDLLIIGTHGRSGVAKVLLGSVAAEALEMAGSDILVARRRT